MKMIQLRKYGAWVLLIAAISILAWQCKVAHQQSQTIKRDPSGRIIVNPHPDPAFMSLKESMESVILPPGYKLQLVASEPMIKEPVAIVWDGDGRLYVAEMRTYMQDVDGTHENDPVCRISLLEDTNGDGQMDKSSIYIDSLVLPRMMLCVGKKLLVNETYTYDIWSYEDTNNDGIADKKERVYQNPKADTRNLEHQKSGLVWNMDNWIYVSCDPVRYRYTNGKLKVDTMANAPGGQWGLANDDYGRMYFSSAGAEIPACGFQINPSYGFFNPKDQYNQDFLAVWPIIVTPDVQGGMGRLRPDTTLNHFTASCGQSVFRGDALPPDFKGDLIICEPVGRLIRRAKVTTSEGKVYLQNAYEKEKGEFITSYDMNFRPVNSTTGPDGNLYIVDMHRGIIQEATWTKEGSFLRPRILQKGLEKNIGRGRIYRVVHDSYKPGPKPQLLNKSASELVPFLEHANGWWRENAQKEIIVSGDRSVVPALQKMAISKTNSAVTRVHALWTMEGLDAIDKPTLFAAMDDNDPQVRKAAVWIAEGLLKKNDEQVLEKLAELKSDTSSLVQVQLALTMGQSKMEQARYVEGRLRAYTNYPAMLDAVSNTLEVTKNTKLFGSRLANMPAANRNLILNGANIYKQLCSTCHGPDGKGLSTGAAPPFVGSKRVDGDKVAMIMIMMNGLSGPVDGKTYTDVMAPFGATNNDEWVASVLSYIRYNFGKSRAPVVDVESVKQARAKSAARSTLWTIEELEQLK